MKTCNMKKVLTRAGVSMTTACLMVTPAMASPANPMTGVVAPIIDLLNSLMGPLLAIVGAVGALYCVVLGVKFAKAEEPQDREKAKSHLKNAIIGFVLIFVLLVVLNLLLPVMKEWVNQTMIQNGQNGIF